MLPECKSSVVVAAFGVVCNSDLPLNPLLPEGLVATRPGYLE